MQEYFDIFSRVVDHNRGTLERHQLVAFVGERLRSMVLKLQKPGWSSPALHENPIHAGIFFSIWINAETIEKGIVHYNIHALQLRALPGYTIKSREFAAAFRAEFEPHRADWENVRIDYGPLTLMEGAIPLVAGTLEADVDRWVKLFIPLVAVIDELLAQRKKS